MPTPDEQDRLQQAANRIRRGVGTKADEQLIEHKFRQVKAKNIKALRFNPDYEDKWMEPQSHSGR
jgi:hypothetical protein